MALWPRACSRPARWWDCLRLARGQQRVARAPSGTRHCISVTAHRVPLAGCCRWQCCKPFVRVGTAVGAGTCCGLECAGACHLCRQHHHLELRESGADRSIQVVGSMSLLLCTVHSCITTESCGSALARLLCMKLAVLKRLVPAMHQCMHWTQQLISDFVEACSACIKYCVPGTRQCVVVYVPERQCTICIFKCT